MPEEKALVQDAAVVGKTFWLGALTRLGGVEASSFERLLHALQRKEFVRRERSSSLAEDTEYAFRHVLVRDVAYGQIPRAERAEKHRAAAEWIEGLGRRDDHAEMLAYHYLQALELGAAAGLDVQAFTGAAQAALADAGDRAFALNAYDAAGRYYRSALDLLPEEDVRRNRLLLKLARGLWLSGEPASDLLEQARDGLLAAGDAEGAGEAETRLAEHYWLEGDRDAASAHLRRARELVDPLPPSPVKAHTIGTDSRFRMLAGDHEEAIRVGLEALAMAEELGLDEVRAAALNNVGTARGNLGDDQGLDDLAEAVRLAGACNAPFELCRAKNNLASHFLWERGRLAAAIDLWQETSEDAKRFGQLGHVRWIDGNTIDPLRVVGRWDDALARADAFIADVEAGRPHYLAAQAYSSRALIRLARGEADAALADAEQARAAAARVGDLQLRLPTLARVAHIRTGRGERTEAASLAAEVLTALHAKDGAGHATGPEVSFALTALGRGQDLAAALTRFTTPWAQAAIHFAEEDPAGAAAIFAQIGDVTDEAYARLAAARAFAEEDRPAERDEQLRRALAFYRSVGATRYIREGEALLAASA